MDKLFLGNYSNHVRLYFLRNVCWGESDLSDVKGGRSQTWGTVSRCKKRWNVYKSITQCNMPTLPKVLLDMVYFSKNTSVFPYCPVLQHCIPPLSEKLCFCSCLFKAPPPEHPICSDWSAHTRLSKQPLTTTEQLCYQFLHAELAARHASCKCVSCWQSVMSQSHKIKGGATDERFRSRVFCGREEHLGTKNMYKTKIKSQIKGYPCVT